MPAEPDRRFATWTAIILAVEIIALAAFYLSRSVAIAGDNGFPLDDSWIHAHFARNIAEGRGFVYNPGQPVSSTTVLYTLLLALTYKIVIAPVFNAVLLGLLLHFGAALLVLGIGRRVGLGRAGAGLAAVAFAATPRLIWGAVGGMEVSLYVFLVCLGIYFQLSSEWPGGIRAFVPTASFALATLARPECGAFLAISLLHRLLCAIRKGGLRNWLRLAPLHVILFGLILLPEVLFNLSYSGHPLPPAFYAKTVHLADAASMLTFRLSSAAQFPLQAFGVTATDCWVVAVGLLAGVAVSLRRALSEPGRLFLVLSFVGVPVIQGAFGSYMAGQLAFQNGRYSAYLVPLAALLAVIGWSAVVGWVARRFDQRLVRYAPAAIVIAGALAVLALGNLKMAEIYGWQVENINDMQVKLGKWARKLPPGDVLAVNDVGAIAFFSRHKVLDTVGVVNPEVVRYIHKYPSYQDAVLAYLQKERPQYVIVFPDWYKRMVLRSDLLQPVGMVRLDNNIACGSDLMVIFRAKWIEGQPK